MSGSTRHVWLWLVTALVSLALLVWLILDVTSHSTRAFDLWVRDGVHRHAAPTLTLMAQWVTHLGSVLFLCVSSVVSVLGLLLARLRRDAIRLASVMAGALGLENGLKFSIQRIRPEAFFGAEPITYSFPSGHSLLSFCFYLTVAAILARHVALPGRFALWCAAALLIAAIGLSRIYLGVHYPTDVIGGYLSAAFWTSLVLLVIAYRARTRLARGGGA